MQAGCRADQAPADHLPGRPRSLAEQRVREQRGRAADGDARARAQRRAGDGDDDGHRLDVGDEREQHPPGGRGGGQRGDQRQLLAAVGAALDRRPTPSTTQPTARISTRLDMRLLPRPGAARAAASATETQPVASATWLAKKRAARAARRGARSASTRPCAIVVTASAASAAKSTSCVIRATARAVGREAAGPARQRQLAQAVHAAGRLVQQQQVGAIDRHRGDREPLPLAARQVARVAAGQRRQAEPLQLGCRAGRALGAGTPPARGRRHLVLRPSPAAGGGPGSGST